MKIEMNQPAPPNALDDNRQGLIGSEMDRVDAPLKAAGSAEELDLNVLGSGSADMSALKAGKAEVNVAGSGNATFASDGEVEANIMGSGDVTVRGRARCKVKTIGSGSLVCEGGSEGADKAA